MKKILILSLIAFSLTSFSPVFAKDKAKEDTWKEIGEQGKKALKETGKFFKEAGTEIGATVRDSVKGALEVRCYGTWTYHNKKCTTTIICNENGTMEITQKEGIESKYWKGDFSVAAKFITFYITEEGTHSKFVKAKDVQQVSKKWFLNYKLMEDEKSIKFTSNDIPSDAAGTDFSEGVVFNKK